MRNGAARIALALAVLGVAGLLGGCRAGPETLERGQLGLSQSAVLCPVPPVSQQEDRACGLACVISLLRYHDREPDAELRLRLAPERIPSEGIAAGALRDALRRQGLRAHLVRGSLDRASAGLLRALDLGLPALVAVALDDEPDAKRHFLLVVGYDPELRHVIVMDPASGAGAVPFADFERLWARADRLMLVAAPEEAFAGR